MKIQTAVFQPLTHHRPAAQAPQPEVAADQFTPSSSDDLKSWAAIGGIGLVGAAIGYGAGAASGQFMGPIIGGPLGAFAGACGGATLGAFLPGEHIKAGAVVGAIAGGVIGATTNHPVAKIALAAAGATLPIAFLFGVMSDIG